MNRIVKSDSPSNILGYIFDEGEMVPVLAVGLTIWFSVMMIFQFLPFAMYLF